MAIQYLLTLNNSFVFAEIISWHYFMCTPNMCRQQSYPHSTFFCWIALWGRCLAIFSLALVFILCGCSSFVFRETHLEVLLAGCS